MTLSPRHLFLIAGVVFALVVFWPDGRADGIREVRQLVGESHVVLFSAEWCGYCDRLRDELTRTATPFAEFDIEQSSAGHRAWSQLGGRGVPLTLVGDNLIAGYQPGRVPSLAATGR
jgi:mycoredoxin